ncbi:hypothetical protein BKA67DRAFT_533254 [Truncatella angustata]|uniref:Uncharacterized protein n=1 Tax=Truncatella angustata TaxID=152316 RepID=A0A9P8UU70_9PEZI|nr:uncharacterized protein BKA67DRAFT_533254 [Truncatella angustata]KAH6658080.1 hypothetical protein BKA67DRAFT_533254 [Truncatella angustata]
MSPRPKITMNGRFQARNLVIVMITIHRPASTDTTALTKHDAKIFYLALGFVYGPLVILPFNIFILFKTIKARCSLARILRLAEEAGVAKDHLPWLNLMIRAFLA